MGDKIMRALAITCLVTLTGAVSSAQEATVEQAIDAIAQKYSEAWKAGDAAGCASLYSDDADVVDFMGMSAKGKAAIQESITQTLSTYPGSSIQIVRTGIHPVSADVVVSDGTWEVTGAKAPEGRPETTPSSWQSRATPVNRSSNEIPPQTRGYSNESRHRSMRVA
jgi:uncharacterized protein (TIGR02246 family)